MKLLLLCLLIPGIAESQKITKEDMLGLYYMPIMEANEYLLERNWYFDQSQKAKDNHEAGWLFSDPQSDLIMAYLSMLEAENGGKTMVYTTFSFQIFQDFRNALSEFELIETDVAENTLYSVYQNEKHTFRLEISSEKLLKENIYTISLVENESYNPTPRE
jgi:hypothetical protein